MFPYRTHVDHDHRTILVVGTGPGTTADTLRLIEGVRETLGECAGYDFLYDAMNLRIESSPADMLVVARALFEEAGARLGRFAIVVPEARVGLARMFTALAHPHGVQADVFTDLREARLWLGLERG